MNDVDNFLDILSTGDLIASVQVMGTHFLSKIMWSSTLLVQLHVRYCVAGPSIS